MIRAKVYLENGKTTGFKISGHAGQAEHGSDIVCAAVSAIAYTALGTISELVYEPEFKEAEGDMEFILSLPEDMKRRDMAYAIMETVRVGLLQIEHSYPEYIDVEIREV